MRPRAIFFAALIALSCLGTMEPLLGADASTSAPEPSRLVLDAGLRLEPGLGIPLNQPGPDAGPRDAGTPIPDAGIGPIDTPDAGPCTPLSGTVTSLTRGHYASPAT